MTALEFPEFNMTTIIHDNDRADFIQWVYEEESDEEEK